MTAESSLPPPPSSGGNAKYALIALIFLAIAGAVFVGLGEDPPPEKPIAEAPKPKNAERSTAMANNELEIPEEEPDAGPPEPEPEPEKKKRAGGSVRSKWDCSGDVPAADIRSVLRSSQGQIRNCYERQLKANSMLQGAVKLQVRIGKTGKVDGTRVRGSLRDRNVRSCIQGLARGWSFPAPTGGKCAIFDAPYNFTPKN